MNEKETFLEPFPPKNQPTQGDWDAIINFFRGVLPTYETNSHWEGAKTSRGGALVLGWGTDH